MRGQVPTARGCQDAWLWAIFCPRLGTQPFPITASRLEVPSAIAPCNSPLLAATALRLKVGLLLGAALGQGTRLLSAGLPAVKVLDCTEDLNLCRKHWLKLPCEACCRRCRAPGKLLTGFLCMSFCRDVGVADVLVCKSWCALSKIKLLPVDSMPSTRGCKNCGHATSPVSVRRNVKASFQK